MGRYTSFHTDFTVWKVSMSVHINPNHKARSFDILAFRGGDLTSNLISHLESSTTSSGEYSHVGMVVKADILPEFTHKKGVFVLDPHTTYVLESTFSFKAPGQDGTPDVVCGKGKFGVQLRNLDDICHRYIKKKKTKIDLYSITHNPIDGVWDEQQKRKFRDCFEDVYGRKYEMDFLGLFGAMFSQLRFARHTRDTIANTFFELIDTKKNAYNPAGWLFCSELLGYVYCEMGILPKSINPQDVLPVDLVGYDKDDIVKFTNEKLKVAWWE